MSEDSAEKKKWNWPKWSCIASSCGALFTLSGVVMASFALQEYTKSNRAEARSQLYGAERSISENEIRDPELQRIYANPSPGADADRYIAELLSIAVHGDSNIKFEPEVPIKHAKDLYRYIWGAENYSKADKVKLRKIYLHAELYIYHLHNCFDLKDEKFITDDEWETWRHLLDEIGPHPISLAVIVSAEENRYFSKEFAKMLQESFSERKLEKAVVQKFYPEIFSWDWPKRFQSF